MPLNFLGMAISFLEMPINFLAMAISLREMPVNFLGKGVFGTLFITILSDFQLFIFLTKKEEQGQEQKQHQSILCFKYRIAKSVSQ
jgi:hypothetical protein